MARDDKSRAQLQYLFLSKGLVILDGSKAMNDWLETDSPIPNTEPFERRPLIESEQYVFNANDSYWLSDPENQQRPCRRFTVQP